MADWMWYLLGANGLVVLLLGLFKLVQSRLSFAQQRWSLLAIPALAIAAVAVKYCAVTDGWSYRIPVIYLRPVELSAGGISRPGSSPFSLELLYWSGVIVFACWMTYRLFRVISLFVMVDKRRENRYTITELPGHDSFSFFRWIQLRPGLPEADRRIVLEHEQLHARKGHSFDLIYLETIQCFAWFNPVWLLFRKELVQLHEFEVDRIMYTRHRTAYMEFLVAYSLGTSSSSYHLFTHQFLAQLTLIQRIKRMKETTKKRWILALALPLAAGSLSLVSWTAESAPVKQPIVQNQDQVATEVDKQPEFKGGMDALMSYLTSNVKYPESAKKASVTGRVVVSFIVTETGKVTKVTIKRSVDPALDKEAKRVVSSMPDWIPGELDGKQVSAEMILPISFEL